MKQAVLFISIFLVFKAEAGNLVALQNQEVSVAVNKDLGTIFQFPNAVNTVTPSKYFSITDIGSSIDPSTGMKTDVRSFQIKPIYLARSESVTFVLVGGKSISFKLSPAIDADKFYDVHFEQYKKPNKGLFSQELNLMKSMILNENGAYPRDILEKEMNTKFENFDFVLTQIYSSSDFTGYVFLLRNKGKETQKINLSNFSFGYPNRAILAHVNSEELIKCPFFGKNQDCQTTLQVVVRGNKNLSLPILSSSAIPPFVKASDSAEVTK